MKTEAEKFNSQGAVCLVVVFGSPANSNDGNYTLSASSCVDGLSKKEVVAKVLRVPIDDEFDLTKAFFDSTTVTQEFGEVLSSHCHIGAHVEGKSTKLSWTSGYEFSKQVLRSTTRKEKSDTVMNKTVSLVEDFGKFVQKNKGQ